MRANDTVTEPPKKRGESAVDKVSSRSKCLKLEDHIMFCMRNFTTYMMCGEGTRQKVDEYNLVGITIIEKTAQITQGPDCTLIHYMCVEPTLHRQGISTSMLKMIMDQSEYKYKKYGCDIII